ncbi:MAG TPA: addiction module protein [Thermoanaerobaculia bacterium]|jgi:putative addiction module component (TIGR02574 family)|nr:addiction module protein [Thermoanaerobaculia bacterium]
MARTLDQVTADALHLPEPERATLVDELLRSLESNGDASFTPEQIADWHHRLDDLRTGRDQGLTLDEFFSDAQ